MAVRRVVIMGAAGRDFHVFNMVFRGDPRVEVVAFTATQIPGIDSRTYPSALVGEAYPEGIPIVPEDSLEAVIAEQRVDEVVFAYSDVSHQTVMHQASRVLAAGADFTLLGPKSTMIGAAVPVVSVCAARTGAGKSQTSRFVAHLLRENGVRPVIVRHPMPYGDLARQMVQRFESLEDLDPQRGHRGGTGGLRAPPASRVRRLRGGGLPGRGPRSRAGSRRDRVGRGEQRLLLRVP